MEPPHLKLVILQGPREGETLGFDPGKVVRIGRIVRNNTFSIKDAGISSNHLSIAVESAKWVIRDLDSSNGTFLNGSKLPPNTPFDLRQGDTIKIGELTSIRVDPQAQEGSCLRRNPRRQAAVNESSTVRKKSEEAEKLEGESSEKVVVEPVEKKGGRPRRGRGVKNEVGEESSKGQLQSIDENVEVGSKWKNVVKLKDKDEKLEGESSKTVVVEPVEKKRDRPRRGRGMKNEVGEESSKVQLRSIDGNVEVRSKLKNVVKLEDKDLKLKGESSEIVVVEPVEKKRGRLRKGRGLKSEVGEESSKVQLQSIDENVEVGSELKNVVTLQEKLEPRVNKQVTRNSKRNQQQQQESVVGTSNSSIVTNNIDDSGLKCTEEKIVEKKARAGNRRRKLQEATSLCDQVTILEDMVQEVRDNTEANQNPGVKEGFEENESKKDCGSVKEACSNKRGGEEACSSQRKDSNENGEWPDLEKLTLGEWFDFLEVHLPKQVIDATEETIDSMKEKAERVRDYMAKQRNDKATLPVG